MSKPLPILSHMPFHIKQTIVESVDTRTKLSIHQCSKAFEDVIEKSKIDFESLMFTVRTFRAESCAKRYIQLSVAFQENHSIDLAFYPRIPDGFIVKQLHSSSEKIVETGNFIDAAVETFIKLLRTSPKIFVKRLEVNLLGLFLDQTQGFEPENQQIVDSLERCLMSLNRLISAKELVLRTYPDQLDILRVLRFVKPAALESITLGPRGCFNREGIIDMDLDQVAETIQWKQAKRLHIEQWYHSLPEKVTVHFESFTCEVRELTIPMLRECVQNFLIHSHWKKRRFNCDDYDRFPLWRSLSQYERIGFPWSHLQRVYAISESYKLYFMMSHSRSLRIVEVRPAALTDN